MADELASALRDQEYHPVLVFGPSASGKTTLILSLLDYLQRGSGGEVSVRRGQQIIPDSYPSADQRIAQSDRFFQNMLLDFQNNIAPERTSIDLPFFIPVDLFHHDGHASGSGHPPAVRLAFVEGMGEWYQIDSKAAVKRPPPFKDDIAEILHTYEKGISIIYAAPTISADITYGSPEYQQKAVEIDAALSNVINEYVGTRPDKDDDYELFLLSKWDTKFGDGIITNKFAGTMEDDVYAHVHSPIDGVYRNAWSTFCGRPRRDAGHLFAMPHFAGRIPHRNPPELRKRPDPAGTRNQQSTPASSTDTAALSTPSNVSSSSATPSRYTFVNTPELTIARNHFNRTLANWLYGNATKSLYGRRVDLFPDVGLSDNKLLRWYEYFIYCLVGGGAKKKQA